MDHRVLCELVLAAVCVFAASGCGALEPKEAPVGDALAGACAGGPVGHGDRRLTITTDDGPREALVHVPVSYHPGPGSMLVLDLHYYTGTPEAEAALTGMTAHSDERGFLLAYPAGLGGTWNAGKCCGRA